ncbi:MAG: hypothetical protein ACOCV1_00845 [Bacillota bacterium]
MKVKDILNESQSIYSKRLKEIERDAKMFRKKIDKAKEKELKEKEKQNKKQKKEEFSFLKKTVSEEIKKAKKNSKSQKELSSIINQYKDSIDPEIYVLCKYISDQIDRLKTKKREGTKLVSRNLLIIPKILEHPLLKNTEDNSILKYTSRLIRLSEPRYNSKLQQKDKIKALKSVNNQLFTTMKDLCLELIKKDIINKHKED